MSTALPLDIDVRSFDELHDQPERWRAVIESIARNEAGETGEVRQVGDSTTLVALLGSTRVLKLFPPFLRDHFDFESVMLELVHGRLSVPTPRKLTAGERDGWPFLVISQLSGEPLTDTWPRMDESERCALLGQIGALTREVHALPVDALDAVSPRWDEFIAGQRRRCVERQQRTRLPAHLLAQVDSFIAGPLPEGPAVALTGEYTPMNLFTHRHTHQHRLAAMFDFGDGLVGPAAYDWLGPLAFLCAGRHERVAAYLESYGVQLDRAARLALMRLFLLHRYSHLRVQIAAEGWHSVADFEELAERLFAVSGA